MGPVANLCGNGMALKQPRKNIVGEPINFRGLTYAPVNEQGVVLLFGMLAKELGFHVQLVRQGYPDCKAVRYLGDGRYEEVNIEFEFRSSGFKAHLNEERKTDIIICWEHNWPDCPLNIEVMELRSLIQSGKLDAVPTAIERGTKSEHKITYSLEDLIKENWKNSHDLLVHFEKALKELGKVERRINKFYIAYGVGAKKSAAEVVPQRQGLKIYVRPKKQLLKSQNLELVDCEHVGHWTNGSTFFLISGVEDIPAAIDLIRQAVELAKTTQKIPYHGFDR
jgi:predicted transport protein